jgi:hypothetical protein
MNIHNNLQHEYDSLKERTIKAINRFLTGEEDEIAFQTGLTLEGNADTGTALYFTGIKEDTAKVFHQLKQDEIGEILLEDLRADQLIWAVMQLEAGFFNR